MCVSESEGQQILKKLTLYAKAMISLKLVRTAEMDNIVIMNPAYF
jgi:hypothetical protein